MIDSDLLIHCQQMIALLREISQGALDYQLFANYKTIFMLFTIYYDPLQLDAIFTQGLRVNLMSLS